MFGNFIFGRIGGIYVLLKMGLMQRSLRCKIYNVAGLFLVG
jgi:hypothetical protein